LTKITYFKLILFRAKEEGNVDVATSQSDIGTGTKKAKREHPKAPDVIGMQDERGGKGY